MSRPSESDDRGITGQTRDDTGRFHAVTTGLGVALLAIVAVGAVFAGPAAAATGSADVVANHNQSTGPQSTPDLGPLCDFEHPEWRDATTVAGVDIASSEKCRPDNPYRVAASVKGTNNVPRTVLMKTGYSPKTVEKSNDRDGDGDPDVIHVRLEVAEVNGYNKTGPSHSLAPGVKPSMWVFSPKTRGMVSKGSKARSAIRVPSPPIRAEAGDTIRVTVENTHYFPHTIHFHGVDHPFETASGQGNDGVPQTSESPIEPGENRTYEFTPEQAGTMFYHCHVVPNVHIQMGLAGMFVVTEDRSNNPVQTLNLGAGKVRHPSAAVESEYDGSYDLHYQALDRELAELPQKHNDPQVLAREMNREHDMTDEQADYFMLNGRSFPYTLQHSPIVVERNSRYRLRVLNSGPGTISLHTHGHKVTKEAKDGVELPERNEEQRDVVEVSPAQRLDVTLNTTVDGTNSYGPGVWFTHDHREKAVTTDGIGPGGGVTVIVYESYFNESAAMPAVNVDLSKFFNASYYDGEIPVWAGMDDRLTDDDSYDDVKPTDVAHGAHDTHMHGEGMMMDMRMVDGGMVVNPARSQLPRGCEQVRGNTTVTVAAGEDYATEGEMYAYNRSTFDFEPCTRVTVEFVNHDQVRHQWMVHGLPMETYSMGMFNIEANPGETVTGTFVTPGEPAVYDLHCSLPQHQQKGMHGRIAVGNVSPSSDGGHSGDGGHHDSDGTHTHDDSEADGDSHDESDTSTVQGSPTTATTGPAPGVATTAVAVVLAALLASRIVGE